MTSNSISNISNLKLQTGDTIGITCPSGYVSQERVSYAKTLFESWGFKVLLGKTVGNEYHYFSGTDEERAHDLQHMLDSPKIKAIIMGRGGYGMSRIIDQLNFSTFSKHPKWLCGFSDITVLHSHIQATLAVPTLHSPMTGHFKEDNSTRADVLSFKNALIGQPNIISGKASIHNKAGKAKGILTGGNLAILSHLTGSISEVDYAGKLLFIEDIGEHLYQIDRMLMQLKRANQLSNLAGLVVGDFTGLEDTERPFGKTIEEIILNAVAEYNYPVGFNFPCGHDSINHTLVLGAEYTFEVHAKGSALIPLSTG